MKRFTRILTLVLGLGFALSTAGCMQRYIIDATDHANGKSTLIYTKDSRWWLIGKTKKDVYWECLPGGKGLECYKACDRKDEQGNEVLCPKVIRMAWE